MRPSAYTARIAPIQLHKSHPGFRRSSEPFFDPSKSLLLSVRMYLSCEYFTIFAPSCQNPLPAV